MQDQEHPFDDAFGKAVDLGNQIAETDEKADLWDIADGLLAGALQYWLYYVYNDYNDKHESDWEEIQLHFDADTAEQALQRPPVEVLYSQHEGAELADWVAQLRHLYAAVEGLERDARAALARAAGAAR